MKKNTFEKKIKERQFQVSSKFGTYLKFLTLKNDYVPKFIKKKFDGSSLLNTLLVKGFIFNPKKFSNLSLGG